MILTRVPEGLMVVRQPEHGLQTGLFADAWGNEAIPAARDRRESARLAAAHHDDGWATWELHPTIDSTTGRPVQFHSLTPLEHVPLYRAGIARAAAIDPFCGLLVSMHGAGLYNDRYGTFRLVEQDLNPAERALVEEFLADMAALQESLAHTLAIGGETHPSADPEIFAHYLRLQAWDRLSLQFVFRHGADGVISPVPDGRGGSIELRCRNDGAFRLRLDPYPFADDAMAFPVRASIVPDREYANPEDFLTEVAAAGTFTIACVARAG